MSIFLSYKKLICNNNKSTTIDNIVNFCKNNFHYLNIDSKWESLCWDSKYCFAKIDRSKDNKTIPLNNDFINFAKLYCFYKQLESITTSKSEIASLKCIEKALLKCKKDANITKLDIPTLDCAKHIALSHYSIVSSYKVINEIRNIAEFTSDLKITPSIVGLWKTNNKRPNDRNKIGSEAKKERDKLLPSDESVAALMELFNNYSKDPDDIFITCVFALLTCAPSRAGEILNLSLDCEIYDFDSKNRPVYGWRFEGSKGFGPTIKWIPKQMWSISKIAINRIKALTKESRELAKWLESGNKKFYKHTGYPTKIKNKGKLTKNEIHQLTTTTGVLFYAKDNISLDELWNQISTKMQPKSFPFFVNKDGYKIKFSEALFCMSKHMLEKNRSTSKIKLWRPTVNEFNSRVSGTQDNKKTIFEKYGYTNKDGSKIHFTSHMMRHYLSTLSNKSGLEYNKLAQWACRVNIEHNETYNHMSDSEKTEKIKQVYDLNNNKITLNKPVNIEEFKAFHTGPVQVSEYGFCLHEYSLSPCIKYNDCLNCNEHICIKGDKDKENRISLLFKQTKANLDQAKQDIAIGLFGADKWYENHEKNYIKLKQLLGIFKDSSIKDGSVISLNNNEFTIIDRSYKLIDSEVRIDIQEGSCEP
jgi:hypothetical protein